MAAQPSHCKESPCEPHHVLYRLLHHVHVLVDAMRRRIAKDMARGESSSIAHNGCRLSHNDKGHMEIPAHMNRLHALFCLFFLMGCAPEGAKPSGEAEKTRNIQKISLSEERIEIDNATHVFFQLRGCQYLLRYSDGNIAHLGTCDNPIHHIHHCDTLIIHDTVIVDMRDKKM